MKNTNGDDASPSKSGSGTSKHVDTPDLSEKVSGDGSSDRLGMVFLIGCALALFVAFAVIGGIIGGCTAALIIFILLSANTIL